MAEQPLFYAPTVHEKVAGFKMPTDPRLWNSEIISYLKSQHPYLPLETAEIDLRRFDAAKGAAVGSVIIGRKVAIPIIIKRPRPGAEPELAPMDVFFHDGRYRYLDPESIKAVTQSPRVGEPEKKPRAFGGNPYIGDVTGDATPLEYSGQASPFAGPFAKTSGLKETTREKATTFGITGTVGGAVRGALTSKGTAKQRAIHILANALTGGVAGTAAGAALPISTKALGLEKKENRRQNQKIKNVVKRELAKESGLCEGLVKNAYLDPNDISNFRRLLATNPHLLQGLSHNFRIVEMITRKGPPNVVAPKVRHPNIVQVYKRDGFIYIKFSGAPEAKTTEEELKSIFGDRFPEVQSRLRDHGVFMDHDGVNQVSWTVKPELKNEAREVNGDGLWAVRSLNGENLVGMVCQAVMDVDGKTLPLKLFVTPEGKYALTGEMFGVRMAGKHRLPSQVPAAGSMGVFVNYVHGTPISTLPLRLIRVNRVKPDDGDERILYLVQNPMTGERITLSPVNGAQGMERMHVLSPGVQAQSFGDVYYMPGDSEWVTLKNPVRLAENAGELRKLSSVDEDLVHVTYTGGQWNITKEAFGLVGKGLRQAKMLLTDPSKMVRRIGGVYGAQRRGMSTAGVKPTGILTSGLRTAKHFAPGAAMVGGTGYGVANLASAVSGKTAGLDEPEARELLVSMGMDVDEATTVLNKTRERDGMDRGVKIAGLHAPQIEVEEVEYPEVREYSRETLAFTRSLRPGVELIKAAAESGHPETLDAILSLEFVTPQNLRYFTDNIPDFEEASTRLAALLVAVRLGMKDVPEQPVKDALEGLSKTVNKLKIMQAAIQRRK